MYVLTRAWTQYKRDMIEYYLFVSGKKRCHNGWILFFPHLLMISIIHTGNVTMLENKRLLI